MRDIFIHRDQGFKTEANLKGNHPILIVGNNMPPNAKRDSKDLEIECKANLYGQFTQYFYQQPAGIVKNFRHKTPI